MSRSCSLLFTLAAGLLAACSQAPEPLPPPPALGPWATQRVLPREPLGPGIFSEAPDSFRDSLHDACRRCVAVEFCMQNSSSPFRRRAERRELEGALNAILDMQHWYVRSTPEGMCVYPSDCPLVRFLDAEGKSLLELSYYPAADGFVRVVEFPYYLSVWDIFSTWLKPCSYHEDPPHPFVPAGSSRNDSARLSLPHRGSHPQLCAALYRC